MTAADYDSLETAIRDGRRVLFFRRGSEYVVVPTAVVAHGRREAIMAVNPTTGQEISLLLDEIDWFEVIR